MSSFLRSPGRTLADEPDVIPLDTVNDYHGPALIEADGDTPEIPVDVRLSSRCSDGRSDWSGTMQAQSDDDRARLRNLTQGRIRLPSNQTGSFVVPNPTWSLSSPSLYERIEIMGNGSPPPF